ncbi:condensation domain-containing protein [Micromonospora sp. NPDC049523]|uniref:condensation domain-containing protein n=1 Tax=Micromonospora sp. NPDC049523 TaxID=3155921 RepID=UPI003427F92F
MRRVAEPVDSESEHLVHAEFAGGRAGTAPLTWGQRSMWWTMDDFRSRNSFLNLCRVVTVPRRSALDVPAVAAVIGTLVARHESLRTRVRLVDGELCQQAYDSGRLPLLVLDADAGRTDGPDDDGAGLAARVCARLGDVPFDHTEEWPLRVALVVVNGRVRRIVLVLSHSTVDFHATETVLRDLRLLLVRGTIDTPPGLQSIDMARREAGAQRRRSDRAISYWTGQFTRLPAGGFARIGPAHTPRYRGLTMVSETVDLASRMIAARHRVSTSTVLLAATAALTVGGDEALRCGLVSMANNRFQPGHGDAIAKLNQLALIAVDLTDRPTFAGLLPRVAQAAMDGYRHAYYDPPAMRHAFAELGLDYLTMLGPYCLVNDIRLPGDPHAAGPDLDERALRATRARTTLTWSEPANKFVWRCRLQVVDAPRAVGLVLTIDTCYLPPERATALLHDVEELLVRAAVGDVPWPWRPSGRPAVD